MNPSRPGSSSAAFPDPLLEPRKGPVYAHFPAGTASLSLGFYQRNVVEVARDLLGKVLVWGTKQAVITETEAYRGLDDPASHAFRGPTARSAIMFGPAGHCYVYLCYGIHYCLNVVAEPPGQAAAVLIRGLLTWPEGVLLSGPGKVGRYLGARTTHTGQSFLSEALHIQARWPEMADSITITPRVGITKAVHHPWRFVWNAPRLPLA